MAEFKVTREIVQEFAETGSIQLPIGILPDSSDLKELLCPLKHEDTSVTSTYTLFSGLGIYTDLLEVADDILRLTYRVPFSWGHVRQQTFEAKPGGPKDYNPHIDVEGKLKGISAVFTCGQDQTESLITLGRGPVAGKPKVYRYRNGPILIAQDEFGRPLLEPGKDAGATWHIPERAIASRVGVLDFTP